MNPGPTEDAARVAVSISDSLKSQPLALALIVMNVLFILLVAWFVHLVRTDNAAERAQINEALMQLRLACQSGG
jgi:hypothetical protein